MSKNERTIGGWRGIAKDPNSREALAFRRETLVRAHARPVRCREDYVRDAARGLRVLDVGVVDHVREAFQEKPRWLHGEIAEVASTCLGVDIEEEGVEALRRNGFNVSVCDIRREHPAGKYDIVVCGDVIEHLADLGAIFRAARAVLVADGRLLVTTPNVFGLSRVLVNLFGYGTESVDHVCYLHPGGLAELGEREGFRLDRYRATNSWDALHRKALVRAFLGILGGLGRFVGMCADAGYETMMYEFAVVR